MTPGRRLNLSEPPLPHGCGDYMMACLRKPLAPAGGEGVVNPIVPTFPVAVGWGSWRRLAAQNSSPAASYSSWGLCASPHSSLVPAVLPHLPTSLVSEGAPGVTGSRGPGLLLTWPVVPELGTDQARGPPVTSAAPAPRPPRPCPPAGSIPLLPSLGPALPARAPGCPSPRPVRPPAPSRLHPPGHKTPSGDNRGRSGVREH